jgi:TonB family protein
MTAARPAHDARGAAPPKAPTPLPRAALILGAVAVIALAWGAVRLLGGHREAGAPGVAAAPPASSEASSPVAPQVPPAQAGALPRRAPAGSGALHSVIPDVPQHARQTIHGRIHVSVRVIVDSDGKVFAALAEQPGPSRYFERLALDAAKQWTFAPDSQARRVQRLRFEFTRSGATAQAVPVK